MMATVMCCTLAAQQYPHEAHSSTSTPIGRAAQNIPAEEHLLFELLNHERTQNSLPALRWNMQLAKAAKLHANLMAERNTLTHGFPDEKRLQERVADAGVRFTRIAENVGVGGDTETIHNALMHSPGHRANILDTAVNEIGIAIVRRGEYLFAVQDFARIVPELDEIQQVAIVASLLKSAGYRIMSTDLTAANSCDSNPNAPLGGGIQIVRYETSEISTLPEMFKSRELKGRYNRADVAACKVKQVTDYEQGFARYRLVVLLYQ